MAGRKKELTAVAEAMCSVRRSLGITQVAMAEKLGVSKQYLNGIEKGRNQVSIRKAGELFKGLPAYRLLLVQAATQDSAGSRWKVTLSVR